MVASWTLSSTQVTHEKGNEQLNSVKHYHTIHYAILVYDVSCDLGIVLVSDMCAVLTIYNAIHSYFLNAHSFTLLLPDSDERC